MLYVRYLIQPSQHPLERSRRMGSISRRGKLRVGATESPEVTSLAHPHSTAELRPPLGLARPAQGKLHVSDPVLVSLGKWGRGSSAVCGPPAAPPSCRDAHPASTPSADCMHIRSAALRELCSLRFARSILQNNSLREKPQGLRGPFPHLSSRN